MGTAQVQPFLLNYGTIIVHLTFHIGGFHMSTFKQLHVENIWKKIPESSKKQNLNLLHLSKYLHNIYIVFT